MAADRLTFGRVSTTYVIPRGTPAPDDVRRLGDVALREHLFTSLAPALARMLPRDDPTVWIIRRLDLDFPFALDQNNAQHNLSALGEVWAAELSRGLVRALRSGENVARFASRAAFLAQFVFDVAQGRDTGCWYYECFESLRALPSSAVIREALVREPEEALAALLELARTQRLAPVIAALHESGARAIYDVAFPAATSILAPSARMIEMLLALADSPPTTPRDALRLAIAMCVEAGEQVAPADIRVHVDRLLEFSSVLASLDEPWRLVEALLDRDLAAAAMLCPNAIDALQFFAQLRPDLLTCAASTVKPSTTTMHDDAVMSRFGGLAMLLPDIDCESPKLRVAIAVECAGTREVLFDPIMRLFADEFDDDADVDASGLAGEVLTRFASRLFGFAGSSREYLYANFLEGSGNIRFRDDEIVVDLPPVPLEVVLHLAGMHDRRFTVPWIPDKTIVLRLGGRP